MLVFSDAYTDSSNKIPIISSGPAKKVNWRAYDITNIKRPIRIQFYFNELRPFRKDTLSFGDIVILSDSIGSVFSWTIQIIGIDSSEIVPVGGDTLFLRFTKPISGNDKFTFTTSKAAYNVDNAREQLDKIKAVPNPYIVTNVFEQPLPPTVRGRGERVINFYKRSTQE